MLAGYALRGTDPRARRRGVVFRRTTAPLGACRALKGFPTLSPCGRKLQAYDSLLHRKESAMREHLPKHIDSITVVALCLMAVSGAMALQHYLAPEPAAEIQFEVVRY
jgi:hypothetical protein